MSSTGTYAQSGASSGGLAARAPGNALVAAAILGLFVLAAVVSAARKDITQGFDEVAHVSYVAQIQHDGDAAPRLPTMRLLDPHTFQFTGAANYLNHPPLFYALLAHLGPKLEGDPPALFAYRLIDIAIAAWALPPCSASELPRAGRGLSFTLMPCRSAAFPFWCRSPAP